MGSNQLPSVNINNNAQALRPSKKLAPVVRGGRNSEAHIQMSQSVMSDLAKGEQRQANLQNKATAYQSVDATGGTKMRQSNSLAKLRPTGGADLLTINHHYQPNEERDARNQSFSALRNSRS